MCLPQPDHPVMLTADQQPPVCTERKRIDPVRVASQSPQARSSIPLFVNLPQLDDAILTATGQQTLRAAGDRPDPAAMALQRTQTLGGFSPRPNPPDFEAAITTATGQQPLRMEGDCKYRVRVSREGAQVLAAADLPHFHQGIFSSTDQQCASGAERQGGHT